jgi:hypothetical protein
MPTYKTPGVYIEEVDRGSKPIQVAGTSVTAFLGWTKKVPVDKDGAPQYGRSYLVTNWTQYVETFGDFVNGAMLPHAVYGYFLNGGGVCYVQSLLAAEAGDGKPTPRLQAPTRELLGRGTGRPALEMHSKISGPVTVIVSDSGIEGDEERFRVVVRGPEGEEPPYENLTFGRSTRQATNVIDALKRSRLVAVRELDPTASPAERRLVPGEYELPAPVPAPVQPQPEPPITPDVITGDLPKRVGILGLEAIEDINIVCMPDLVAWQKAGRISLKDVQTAQTALINHCEQMKDRVAVLDTPAGLSAQEALEWRMGVNYDTKYAALYYPWIEVADPIATDKDNRTILVPPSGYVAGIYARVDQERGVHKAPANEIVRGALGLELQVTHGEQGELNMKGVNCIRSFPGRGIRVWGARTLSNDTSWTYVNVRRLFCMVEESIYQGTQWVVFEPNDLDLWERVKRTVTAFLTRIWRDGALFGATPEEAFYVKCDAELNPPSMRDTGYLTVEVGLAPVKPAEFVVFKFSQFSGVDE